MSKKKFNIVFPSYRNHYDYNVNFLKSFDEYCQDKDSAVIYFIVNVGDKEMFLPLIDKFPSIEIKISTLTDLIQIVDNVVIYDNLFNFNSKFPVQALKKLYAYALIKDDYLVMDSENLCLKNFNIKDIFRKMKSKPIFSSKIIKDELQKKVVKNCNNILKMDGFDSWFFLKSYWFYEYKHVVSLINYLKESHKCLSSYLRRIDFFDYQLYSQFIEKFNLKKIIDSDTLIINYSILLSNNVNYEYLCRELNEDNIGNYIKLVNDLEEKILRLHWMPEEFKNKLINNTDVCIGTFHWDKN